MNKIICALVVMAIPFSAAHAQAADGTSATASGTVGATFIQPLQISHDTGATLNLGTLMASSVNGRINVDLNGTTNGTTGSVYHFKGSTVSADSFTVTGEPNKAITITVPYSIKLTGPNAAEATVWPITKELTATLSGSGTYQLKLGGYISLSSPMAAGKWSGTYAITVAYN